MICKPFNDIVGAEPEPGGVNTARLVGSWAVFAGLSLSVTRTVKFATDAVAAVPLRTPVVGFRVIPDGRVPVARDHVYGVLPPEAVIV